MLSVGTVGTVGTVGIVVPVCLNECVVLRVARCALRGVPACWYWGTVPAHGAASGNIVLQRGTVRTYVLTYWMW